jgi:hypothetical protein
MRYLVIALALVALSAPADAQETRARSSSQTPSIMVDDTTQPRKAERRKASRSKDSRAGRGQASKARHPVQHSTSVRYRYVRVPRQEINDVGQNLRLRSDYILRRQQLEIRRDSQINVLRSEIQRQQFNRPVGSPYSGYRPGGLRY